jgi:hypothetical protein
MKLLLFNNTSKLDLIIVTTKNNKRINWIGRYYGSYRYEKINILAGT